MYLLSLDKTNVHFYFENRKLSAKNHSYSSIKEPEYIRTFETQKTTQFKKWAKYLNTHQEEL